MNIARLYLKASSISAFSKLYTSFAAIAVLWLINAIAGKDGLGLIMTAYALNYILGSAVASWMQSIVMFYTSRAGDAASYAEKNGAALFYTIIAGGLIAGAQMTMAPQIAEWMNKPEAEIWIATLAWMTPAFAINSLLTSWYRARQDVPKMVIYFEIWPATLRLLFLSIIFAMTLPAWWIGAAFVVSFLLPFCILYIQHPLKLYISPFNFSAWDMAYGSQNALTQIMTKSVNNLVIVLLGFLASAGTVAEFTVAMRFVQFLQLPKLALAQLQVPRIGMHLAKGTRQQLKTEYDLTRLSGLVLTLIGIFILLLAGPFILSLFGEYKTAYPLLILLAVAAIIRVGFGTAGGYLSIAGYAGWGLVINALTFGVLIGTIAIAVPPYQGYGAALATILAALTSMVVTTLVLKVKESANLLSWPAALAMLASSCILCLQIYFMTPIWLSAIIMVIVAGGLSVYEIRKYKPTIREFLK